MSDQGIVDAIVSQHRAWLRNETGGKQLAWAKLTDDEQAALHLGADLRGADLEGADLQGADLRGANLREANLDGADLRGADLTGAGLILASLQCADFRGADLACANLAGADLEDARGAVVLPVGDPRGFVAIAVRTLTNRGWTVYSGCRKLTLAAARQHWGDPLYQSPAIGARYLRALDWLEPDASLDARKRALGIES